MTARAPRPLGVDSATIVLIESYCNVAAPGFHIVFPIRGGHGGPPLQLYLEGQHHLYGIKDRGLGVLFWTDS